MKKIIQNNYKILLNQLILVDFQDKFISSIDKWQAHSNSYLRNESSMPHRAFSIFIFNQKDQLLLQQRSIQKKTFPLFWSNSCCSHPNMIINNQNQQKQQPIRNSLHRALDRQFKMNITDQQFYYVDKILYKKEGLKGIQDFGQYQVDYVYLVKLNRQIQFQIVPSQIANTYWVKKLQLGSYIQKMTKNSLLFTPWFLKMYQNGLLMQWWSKVEKNQLKNQPNQQGNIVKNML